MQHDGGRLAFQETTDRIIRALGIRTGKQRLDSTHIMSNIATLTRLGLFCETMRLFLRALRWEHPELRPVVPEGLLGHYLKEEDEATHYEDAGFAPKRPLAPKSRFLLQKSHSTYFQGQSSSVHIRRALALSIPQKHLSTGARRGLLQDSQWPA